MVGSWESTAGGKSRFEVWEWEGEESLTGEGYVLIKNDTVFSEHLEIRREQRKLTYYARVPGSEKEGEVAFVALRYDKNHITFENQSYELPQRMFYIFKDDGSMEVVIEGYDGGIFKDDSFGLKK